MFSGGEYGGFGAEKKAANKMREEQGRNREPEDDSHCRREKSPPANERLPRRSPVIDAAVLCSTGRPSINCWRRN
ncbi:hypothetical protein HAX54_006124 [Datura stramonium]|uniref:Uncharacterized protein n=1 Tax=Datura stramonium TaxID=4076 RepID=A0ABS8TC56_DATST|nr:hypothetical protein [Datura stramonium]